MSQTDWKVYKLCFEVSLFFTLSTLRGCTNTAIPERIRHVTALAPAARMFVAISHDWLNQMS